jgi:hypothetical protein
LKKVADNRETTWPWNSFDSLAKPNEFIANEIKQEYCQGSEKDK